MFISSRISRPATAIAAKETTAPVIQAAAFRGREACMARGLYPSRNGGDRSAAAASGIAAGARVSTTGPPHKKPEAHPWPKPPSHGPDLVTVVALLGAGVVAVPIFKRLGLGSVLGYLAAGLAIGPFGLGLFTDPQTILHVAELGVVMFLFVIGLEMQPSRLWALRRRDLRPRRRAGRRSACCCSGPSASRSAIRWRRRFIAGMGFVLTSTAIVMQMLEERGEISQPKGQRIVSILLLEDLAIVPLLALVALPRAGRRGRRRRRTGWSSVGDRARGVAALVAAGRWLLNPLFRMLAAGAGARGDDGRGAAGGARRGAR